MFSFALASSLCRSVYFSSSSPNFTVSSSISSLSSANTAESCSFTARRSPAAVLTSQAEDCSLSARACGGADAGFYAVTDKLIDWPLDAISAEKTRGEKNW